ncbi:MAG: mannosyltransferase [Solirubrobacteraceae bacterium]|jgi:mannosyltransferase|nr:mannosyltransferase [Solirubrobacteraceae bacterium]
MSTSEYPALQLDGAPVARLRPVAAVKAIPADVWVVGLLFVAAAVIRFATIGSQSFWTDEALTGYEVRLPFGAMVHTVTHVETTPPLYFLLIWVWGKLLGSGDVALRSLSALAGCALVPIAYLSARELVSRWAGVIAAAFVAVNPFLIWYSQEARAYMLLAALTGASFLFFVRAQRNPSRGNLSGWAIFSSLAVMTHFFAGFTIAPEALWLLWTARTRGVVLSVALVAAAQVAMTPFAFFDSGHGVGWIELTSRFYRFGQVPLQFGLQTLFREYTPAEGLIGGGIVLGIAVALLILAGDRRSRRGAALTGGIAAVGILAPLALMFVGQDYFLARNLIGVWLPLALLIATACAIPRVRPVGGLFAAALIAMFCTADVKIQTEPRLQKPEWRDLAQVVGPAKTERGILIAGGASADPLRLYLPGVTWTQPPAHYAWIHEIDVIGTRHKLNWLIDGFPSRGPAPTHRPRRQSGPTLPRSKSPPGTRLLTRFSYDQWVLARFALSRPVWANTTGLAALAPRFFRRTPSALLVVLQPRRR